MKITPLKFLKFWMMVSFSKEMWGSWYFIIFYFLIFTSNAFNKPEESTLHKWPLQVAMMVFLALLFGLMATIMGLVKFYDKQRVQRETEARMAYAERYKQQQKELALVEFINQPIGNTTDAEVTEFIKVNIRLK